MPHSALSTQSNPAPAQPGVYRCPRQVNGAPIWYEWDGRVLAVHVVQPGEDEAEIASQMWAAFRAHQRPKLALVKADPSLSRSRPFALGRDAMRGLFRKPAPRPVLLPLR